MDDGAFLWSGDAGKEWGGVVGSLGVDCRFGLERVSRIWVGIRFTWSTEP